MAAPVPRPLAGQPAAQFNPTTAINLLFARGSLRNTQDVLLNVWRNHYASGIRLARKLGTMQLDYEREWTEPGRRSMRNDEPQAAAGAGRSNALPPEIPQHWIDLAESDEWGRIDGLPQPVGTPLADRYGTPIPPR